MGTSEAEPMNYCPSEGEVPRGTRDKGLGSPLFLWFMEVLRVCEAYRQAPSRPIWSQVNDREWLVRNWLSSPAQPSPSSHPVWGEVMACGFSANRRNTGHYKNFGHLQCGKPFSVREIHPTSYIIPSEGCGWRECDECDLLRMVFRHARQAYK